MPTSDHAHDLRAAITALTDRFAYRRDLEVTLTGITDAAVHLIPGAAAADVLVITHPEDHTSLAATSPLATDISALQRRHHQGPSLDAASGETMVLSNDLRDEPRWPWFAASAVQAEVRIGISQMHVSRLLSSSLAALRTHAQTAD